LSGLNRIVTSVQKKCAYWEKRFRDANWHLGFADASVAEIDSWSRLFASLFVIALLILTTLGMDLLNRALIAGSGVASGNDIRGAATIF
jgi:hypothetical protein